MTKKCHGCKCKEYKKGSRPVSYDCPCYCCLHGHMDICPK